MAIVHFFPKPSEAQPDLAAARIVFPLRLNPRFVLLRKANGGIALSISTSQLITLDWFALRVLNEAPLASSLSALVDEMQRLTGHSERKELEDEVSRVTARLLRLRILLAKASYQPPRIVERALGSSLKDTQVTRAVIARPPETA